MSESVSIGQFENPIKTEGRTLMNPVLDAIEAAPVSAHMKRTARLIAGVPANLAKNKLFMGFLEFFKVFRNSFR